MSLKDQLIQQRNLVNSFANRGITVSRGEGAYLYDDDGKQYLDFMSNYGVNILGYGVSEITQALSTQFGELVSLHASFNSSVRSNATKKLVGLAATSKLAGLKRVYWANSGAEAVEAALKFAYLFSGRQKFLAATNSYHGKTLAALSATSSSGGKYQKPFKKLLLNFDYVEYGDIESLEKTIDSSYAALILEPVQGEGGVRIPSAGFLRAASELCKQHGVLLIVDEIQTGLGRTGENLAISRDIPRDAPEVGAEFCDILCLGKGLAAGIPVGAALVSEKVNAKIEKGLQTSTFSGNPLAMAGVVATIDYLESKQIAANSRQVGEFLLAEVEKLRQEFPENILEVRGLGLMLGFDVSMEVPAFLKKLQEAGLLLIPASGNTVRILPPLTLTKDEAAQGVSIIRKVLTDV